MNSRKSLHVSGNERAEVTQLRGVIRQQARRLARRRKRFLAAKHHFEWVMNAMQEAVLVTDERNVVLDVNCGGCALLARGRGSILGTSMRSFLRGADRLSAEPPLSGETFSGFVETGLGKLVPVLVSSGSHPNEPQARGRRVFVVQDMTEYRALQTQLFQAQKLESIGQLAAGIAHEINTPIQFVGDNTHFLQQAFSQLSGVLQLMVDISEKGGLPAEVSSRLVAEFGSRDVPYLLEEIPRAVSQTLEGVERVARIVRAMKEFSHPGTHQKQLTNLHHLIESTITVSTNEWKYVADVELDLQAEVHSVRCLPGEIGQVLLNLIVNSAHAIAEDLESKGSRKGKITIRTEVSGEAFTISVTDTGCGIPESIQHRVFDPFFTTKALGKGSGQGLAMARAVVVEKHRGTLSFDTTAGVGTTFRIQLPFDDAADQAASPDESGDARQ